MATVTLNPGQSIQAAINANPGLTTFALNPGVYTHTEMFLQPKSSNTFINATSTKPIIDGQRLRNYCFYSNNAAQSNVTITGLEIKNYLTPISAFGAISGNDVTNWTVTDCVVHDNVEVGIRAGGLTGWQVLRNICYNNGRNGIGGYRCHNALIENNECYANGAALPVDNGGMKIFGATGLRIFGNYFHHNTGKGVWCDTNYSTVLIQGNTVTDNTGTGIYHEISYAAVISNNTSSRNGHGPGEVSGSITRAGIQVTNSPNVEVYGNTVSGNWNGISGLYFTGYATTGPEGTYILENLNVHDNVIQMAVGKTGIATNTGDLSIFTSRNNHFTHDTYRVPSLTSAWFAWGA